MQSDAPAPWAPIPLEVRLALLWLVLSVTYASVFSHLVYVSLVEQVWSPNLHPPRYAAPIHYHNAIEWVLLAAPAVVGWLGAAASGIYLLYRWVAAPETA